MYLYITYTLLKHVYSNCTSAARFRASYPKQAVCPSDATSSSTDLILDESLACGVHLQITITITTI
jgi:hypothetical protein